MPKLQDELEQLLLANRHIHETEVRVATMRASIERSRLLGMDTREAEALLQVILEGLDTFLEHRRLIERNIDDIHAGRLPT